MNTKVHVNEEALRKSLHWLVEAIPQSKLEETAKLLAEIVLRHAEASKKDGGQSQRPA